MNNLEKSRKNLFKKINNCTNLCDPEIVKESQKLDKYIVNTMFKKRQIRKKEVT